jgi:hypothetical protein
MRTYHVEVIDQYTEQVKAAAVVVQSGTITFYSATTQRPSEVVGVFPAHMTIVLEAGREK